MSDDSLYFNSDFESKVLRKISVNNQQNSHWVALKHLNIAQLNSYCWKWRSRPSMDARIDDNGTVVLFHPDFSSGTEIVEGNIEFTRGNIYFWEIELLGPVYGTDMMVGLIGEGFNTNAYQYVFRGALGDNENSWGVSYHGYCQHAGQRIRLRRSFHPLRFGDGTKIGMVVDTWNGCTTLYINGKSYGEIWRSEKFISAPLRPAVLSTAARTKMRLRTSFNSKASLEYFSCVAVSQKYTFKEIIKSNKHKNAPYSIFLEYFWLFH